MSEADWIRTASQNAVVTRNEVLQWLKITAPHLKRLLEVEGFPAPRFKGRSGSSRTTRGCRWRVGDIRAWLEASADLRKELAKPVQDRPDGMNRRSDGRLAADELWRLTH